MDKSKAEINAYYDGVISGIARYAIQKGESNVVGASEAKLSGVMWQVECQRRSELEAADIREAGE